MTNPPINPSFCKIMIGDFKTSLRIPPAFKKHLKRIHGKSYLRSNRGGRWGVDVCRVDGDCFLRKGWTAFTTDNAIALGDFLIFIFDGRYGFDVKVYGCGGLQKEAGPLIVDKKKSGIGNPGKDPANPIKLYSPIAKIKKSGKPYGRSSSLMATESDEIKRELAPEDMLSLKTLFPRKKKPGLRRPKNPGKDPSNPMKLYSPIAPTKFYEKPSGSSWSKRELVLQAALSLKTSRPSFICVIVIRSKYQLTIPTEFVRQYDLCKGLINLRNPVGSYWHVKVVCRTDGRTELSRGWSEFMKGNCLREGDVCVFEIDQQSNEMHVHIFRVKEETEEMVESPSEQATSEVHYFQVSDDMKELVQKSLADEVTSVIVAESGDCGVCDEKPRPEAKQKHDSS